MFARSLVAIFIPIFLLKIGFQIEEVLLYYCIYHAINVPLNFLAGWMTKRFGARRIIMLGVIFLILFLATLFNIQSESWTLLILMTVFAALYDAFYWVAHIFFFMKCSEQDENVTKDASTLYIVKRFAGVLAPFFGALVLIFFSQKVLLLISIVILCLSFWPLFKIKDIDDKTKTKIKSPTEFMSHWTILKDYLFMALFSIHSAVETVLWPIFIFLVFKSIESVAALPIIISLSAIIFTYFAGRLDKKNRNTMIAVGSLMLAMIWLVRINFDYTIVYYASVFLVAFFSILVTLPLDSEMFEKGEKKDALSTSMYRNATSMFSRSILFLVLLLLVSIFKVSFFAAALSMIMLTLINLFIRLKIPKSALK